MIKTKLIEPINKILLKQGKVQNKKIAFSDFNSEINYYELERKTLNLASNILSLGLSKGDAVALILPNSVEWVIAFLGTLRAGLTIVPISFDSTTEEINYKLHDSNTKFVITSIITNMAVIIGLPALLSVITSMFVFIVMGIYLFNLLIRKDIPI